MFSGLLLRFATDRQDLALDLEKRVGAGGIGRIRSLSFADSLFASSTHTERSSPPTGPGAGSARPTCVSANTLTQIPSHFVRISILAAKTGRSYTRARRDK